VGVMKRVILFATLAIVVDARCFGEVNKFTSPGSDVTVVVADPHGSTRNPVFDVKISYKFDAMRSVWLQGVGKLPASGEVSYVLRGSWLAFFDKKNGNRLASVKVAAIGVKQSPALGDPYPSTAQGWSAVHPLSVAIDEVGAWDSFKKTLDTVYSREMGSTPCRPDDDGCLLTQWTSITAPADLMQMQMAVMMTYRESTTQGGHALSVKIFYMLRQAPIGEGLHWDYQVDDSTRQVGLARLKKLQDALALLHR